jgi:hypothetical protein
VQIGPALSALAAFAFIGPATAATWSLEGFGGNAYNLRSGLHIAQDDGYSASVRADYDTRGWRSPLYYMLRAGRWSEDRAWEVSVLHHKLYLSNPPAGVADVSVSHGFNIVSLNRAFRQRDWIWRLGAGPVVTHAEATILGTRYDGPYTLAGVALVTGVGRRFYLAEATYLAFEGGMTAAYAKPQLEGTPGATLTVRNFALHGLLGIGLDF